MTTPETLLSLAERVEALSGPDREVDVAIGLTGKFFIAEPRYPGAVPLIGRIDEDGSRVEPGNGAPDWMVPRYTASLDAAMSLVPDDYEWGAGTGRSKHIDQNYQKPWAWCVHMAGISPVEASSVAATPALALCAASLRARAATLPMPTEDAK